MLFKILNYKTILFCRSIYETSEHVVKRPELPRLVFELQPDEEALEEKIQVLFHNSFFLVYFQLPI